ncbi:MAG TPA: class 1 isoprenoid biosynthesis enzyme [Candidatus Brocadiia bacterium]|nr:class 1 isoprenoid biosynthesis enzyme [Candidatus Brocadiia bacterium]
MTLSPVFRSEEAAKALKAKGYLKSLSPALKLQRTSVKRVRALLPSVIGKDFIARGAGEQDDLTFVQENFFLTLFLSLFQTLEGSPDRVKGYAALNVCIKGLVTSGDNLFDREAKMDLPLKVGAGACFASILQMMCFMDIVDLVLEQDCPFFSSDERVEFKRSLLTRMARIGTLEGREEGGVADTPAVKKMVDTVHRVRGGELFALAFTAPEIGERKGAAKAWIKAEEGVRRLGTAFQLVDDVTDFEFDIKRRSYNIVIAEIVHHGTAGQKATLKRLWDSGARPEPGTLEEFFAQPAAAALDLARREAEEGFRMWQELGFWFPPQDAGLFVRAIAGSAGDERVRQVADQAGL